MKNVIILSCSTGQGHNSCAQAIKEYFEQREISCEIQDAFDFISENFARFMSWGHAFMYRYIPKLFQWGYGYSKAHPGVFDEHTGIYKILTAGVEKMYHYIYEKQFDTIICTHVFSAIMTTHMQNRYPLEIQTAFVATDYTCYPGMSVCNLQQYFIPCECFADTYYRCGISQERLCATGIPVCCRFFENVDKKEAKKAVGISSDKKHLLIMCGSMGCGPIPTILKYMEKLLSDDVEITVICGTNKKLYRKLKRKHKKQSQFHIMGYTQDIPLYLDSADLYLTKPGGISVTEAAAKNLPMVFVNAVAGCEQYNMNFFIGMGAAVTADTSRKIAEKTMYLLNTSQERRAMERALQEYRQPNGAECVYYEMKKWQYDR